MEPGRRPQRLAASSRRCPGVGLVEIAGVADLIHVPAPHLTRRGGDKGRRIHDIARCQFSNSQPAAVLNESVRPSVVDNSGEVLRAVREDAEHPVQGQPLQRRPGMLVVGAPGRHRLAVFKEQQFLYEDRQHFPDAEANRGVVHVFEHYAHGDDADHVIGHRQAFREAAGHVDVVKMIEMLPGQLESLLIAQQLADAQPNGKVPEPAVGIGDAETALVRRQNCEFRRSKTQAHDRAEPRRTGRRHVEVLSSKFMCCVNFSSGLNRVLVLTGRPPIP